MKKGGIILLVILTAVALVFVLSYSFSHYDGTSHTAATGILLSEVMTSNKGTVLDEYGDTPDWVELYNATTNELDISGFGLSDDLLAGAKYVFPSGTVLPAEGYIVVFCSGEQRTNLHAPFKLSANEELILYDSSGTPLDSLELTAVQSGYSLSRSGDAWEEMKPSPGYPNTQAGAEAYEASLQGEADIGVYISEFMPSNKTTIQDSYGVYSDWIELYNSTSKDVDLSGMGISDNLSQPSKHRFPEGTRIKAGGYLLVFCSGNQSAAGDAQVHVPFSLRAYEEDVVLSDKRGYILDSVSYSRLEPDVSMVRTQGDTFEQSTRPTPGYPNTDEGYSAFTKQLSAQVGDVYISEMMGANSNTYAASDGEYYDWVELYNRGSAAVSLKGYGLTDNVNNPAKWVFGDVSLSPGEYLVLYASGLAGEQAEQAQKKNLHLNFGLSASGETLYLFDPDGNFLDKLSSGAFSQGISCGRSDSLALYYYEKPTPGAANGTGAEGITQAPVFSLTPGIYDKPVTVELKAGADETIYYTLDATTPTKGGAKVYSEPIAVSKNTVIRAVSVRNNYITGDVNSATYLFTTDGVNHALPVATLVTDPDNLWNAKTGIYAHGEKYDPSLPYGEALLTANYFERDTGDSREWERPGSFSVFSEQGQQVFSQNIGLRIAGAYGRGRAQKGFNITARDEYGANRMQYSFFENRPYTEYKALVLRAGGQDQNRSKIRDELATGLLEGTDVNFLYQAYKPYVLYLNGEYWGVYFLKEKRNRFFVAQHEGTENVTDMNIGKASTRVTYGTNKEWLELMDYVATHDLSVKANYDYVAARLDVNSFMDYMVCELYTGNSDYANIQYYKLPDGKWKWIYYDFCWGFTNYNHQTVSLRRGNVPAASGLFNALLKNNGWKDAFVRRFAQLMNSAFSQERVGALIAQLYAEVEPEIRREREKFNSATFMGVKQHDECLGSYDSFVRQIEYLREFAQKRPELIKAQLKSELGLSDAYMKEVFGG